MVLIIFLGLLLDRIREINVRIGKLQKIVLTYNYVLYGQMWEDVVFDS